MTEPAKLSTKALKIFAEQNLTGTLREVILLEKDELEPQEFLAKVEIWLRLLRMEASR